MLFTWLYSKHGRKRLRRVALSHDVQPVRLRIPNSWLRWGQSLLVWSARRRREAKQSILIGVGPWEMKEGAVGDLYRLLTKEVTFRIDLEQPGVTQLEAWFLDETDEARGYVYIERLKSEYGPEATG